jgi:hypothetical protein
MGTKVIQGTSETTRNQGLQQETGLILGMSKNHQEPGATAGDRNNSGDGREPSRVRGTEIIHGTSGNNQEPGLQQGWTGLVEVCQETTRGQGLKQESGLIQGTPGNHQEYRATSGIRTHSRDVR